MSDLSSGGVACASTIDENDLRLYELSFTVRSLWVVHIKLRASVAESWVSSVFNLPARGGGIGHANRGANAIRQQWPLRVAVARPLYRSYILSTTFTGAWPQP